jgi:polyisoprenoid-binding protein YceI
MAPSGQTTTPDVQALLRDSTLAGEWALDTSTSTIGLKSKSMWGLVPVKGVFREVTGQGTVSAAGEVSGAISVAAASIDTKMKKRDVHLRSKDFFDSDNFPAITFAVAQLTPSGDGVTVAGHLTVRDRTQPISFPAKVSVLGSGEVQLDAAVPVNRADFGLTWNQMGMASMANTITVHAVFRKR